MSRDDISCVWVRCVENSRSFFSTTNNSRCVSVLVCFEVCARVRACVTRRVFSRPLLLCLLRSRLLLFCSFVCLFVSNSETTCSRIALLACRSFIVIFGDILGVVLVRSLFCVEVRSVLNTTLVGILVRLSAALSGRRALIAGVDT